MRHIAGDYDRKYQLPIFIGECRIQVSADVRSTDGLTDGACQYRGHMHVDILADKVQCSVCRKRAAIESRGEVIGICNTIDNIECAGKFS